MNSKGRVFDFDWGLLIPVFVLILLGLATLFSINISYFKSQLTYIIFSLFAFVFFANTNYRIFKYYSVPFYVASLILLSLVLLLGIQSRGAVRWLDIFGLRIQFSEILKPILAISLSSFLADSKNYTPRPFLYSLLFLFPIAFLVYIQPDLGNALIYIFVTLFTLLIFGFPLLWFFLGFLAFLATVPVFWRFLHDYQRQRLLTFLNPTHDPSGTSYNAIQAIMAVGSGMIFGKGLGEGTQSVLRFLPERHTDFIFAALAEEFGFLGSLVIIVAFAFLLYKIFLIFQNSEEKFCRIFSICAFFVILVQLFLNIGMNIGIVPIVGITLPFVSYGGSSILSNFILLGLLSSISKNIKNKDVLEIR